MLYTLYRVGARGPADLDMGSKVSKKREILYLKQCLGSGSVGSAKCWLPGSGSKRQNINQKLQQQKNFTLKTQI